ncbi:MAG: hypothetical protein ACI9KE_003326 [Polyangiales bacterium]|jgi:hypothetical protein
MLLTLASCDCGAESQQVDGPHPYVRCLAFEAEEGPLETLGGVVEGQTLSLQNVDSVEFFAVRASSLAWLGENESDALQVVLGGFARDEANAVPLLTALAARGPALLLLGGEDDVEIFQDAFDEVSAPNLISLLGIRRVDLGSTGMVVVPGAQNGRYGRGDSACGYAAEDLALLGDDAEAGDLLVSWMVPTGEGIDEGILGQRIGDEALAQAAAELALAGGVHAWPTEQAGFRGAEGKHFVVSALDGLQVSPEGGRFLGGPLTLRIDGGAWSAEPDSP